MSVLTMIRECLECKQTFNKEDANTHKIHTGHEIKSSFSIPVKPIPDIVINEPKKEPNYRKVLAEYIKEEREWQDRVLRMFEEYRRKYV